MTAAPMVVLPSLVVGPPSSEVDLDSGVYRTRGLRGGSYRRSMRVMVGVTSECLEIFCGAWIYFEGRF